MPKINVVICSKNRPRELKRCLYFLKQQAYKDFDYVVIDLDISLVQCRQLGVDNTKGEIVVFIDDDVEMGHMWLWNIIAEFNKDSNIVGVTGPTIVPEVWQMNRDIFKYFSIYKFFNKSERPGYFSKWGVPSMYSNFKRDYYGKVSYLECCNMALRRDIINRVGGFDLNYEKTSEWSEVDLAMRCSLYGKLIFSPRCALEHYPSKAGVYKDRLDTSHRYRNYIRFSDKHLKPCWQLTVYKLLYGGYLWLKEKVK